MFRISPNSGSLPLLGPANGSVVRYGAPPSGLVLSTPAARSPPTSKTGASDAEVNNNINPAHDSSRSDGTNGQKCRESYGCAHGAASRACALCRAREDRLFLLGDCGSEIADARGRHYSPRF